MVEKGCVISIYEGYAMSSYIAVCVCVCVCALYRRGPVGLLVPTIGQEIESSKYVLMCMRESSSAMLGGG